jgi:hypothetical protein
MGFAKAYDFAKITALPHDITKPTGLLWLFAMLIFVVAAINYSLNLRYWWLIALIGTLLSQGLIMMVWQAAKFGTIANVIILIVAGFAFAEWRFAKQYRQDVIENLSRPKENFILTPALIARLPEPVQRYIIHSGAIGKPVPKNFSITFEGLIRQDEKSAWMPFTSEQYNFIGTPARFFYMKAKMKGFPVCGYHSFKDGRATMDIRLFSLFTVQYQYGSRMDQSETVTWFNDLCLFAPGALIDERIDWEELEDLSAKAMFSNNGITISALLYFNEKDELINFISDNRYRITNNSEAQLVRFSTPVKNYQVLNEHLIPAYGEAVWRLPEGDLTYGQFNCKAIQYNATH